VCLGHVDLQCEGLGVDHAATLGDGLQSDLANTVHDAVLLLARDIHDVQRKELTGELGEGDVHVDFHALAWAVGLVLASS
jgi:hypothetical protein